MNYSISGRTQPLLGKISSIVVAVSLIAVSFGPLVSFPQVAKAVSCTQPVDIVIALDVSGSLSATDLANLKIAAKTMVDTWASAPGLNSSTGAVIGVTKFRGSSASVVVMSTNITTIKNAIDAVTDGSLTSGSNMVAGINGGSLQFATGLGDRAGAPNILIVITDANETTGKTETQITTASDNANAVRIIAVDVENDPTDPTLISIAKPHVATNVFSATSLANLITLADDIAAVACAPTTATLTLVKSVVNNDSGTALATAWTLSASGLTTISGTTGSGAVTNATVNPDTYTLSENSGPSGYTPSTYSCVKNAGTPVVSNSITLAAGDTATCTITNDDNNVAPVANDDPYSTDEDVALVILASGVLGNDVDTDPLTAALVLGPSNGTLVLNTNGGFTYTPNANFNGSDSFTYQANDVDTNSNTATVNITVNPVNDNPDAVNDAANVNEDSVDNVISVLANDTIAPDTGETLSITSVSSPTNGTAVIDGTTIKYTPNAGYVGTDSFTYTISDGNGGTDTATVNVTVSNTQDAPVAVADGYTTNEDTLLSVAAPGVLGNDSDADVGDTITAVLDTTTPNGSLTLSSDGSFGYTPGADFNGSDSFTYHAIDNNSNVSNTVTVTITVTPVNDAPVSTGQTLSTAQNVAVPGVLGATDVDGNSLTFATTSNPTNGTITVFNPATGAFTYTPNNNFTGSDSFDFEASDGSLTSNISTVTINVSSSPENTPSLCSDTLDNDNDGLIDLADPDCASFIPTLTVIKVVVNDNSGTATSSDFTITVTGTNVSNPSFAGSEVGSTTALGFGAYSVAETGPSGYIASMSADCSGTITAGENKTCTITNDDIAPTPTPPAPPSGGGGGGSGPFNPVFGPPAGSVLGASTSTVGQVLGASCGLYMNKHLRYGSRKNDVEQTKKLQTLLNKVMGTTLPITGFYGPLSVAAVKAFQAKYSDGVLKPWGISAPTGLVYLSTLRQINLLECSELPRSLPALIPWSQNPNAQ